eukprot:scaffold33536_cov55-Phaeocystis_antarctica.AAC.2
MLNCGRIKPGADSLRCMRTQERSHCGLVVVKPQTVALSCPPNSSAAERTSTPHERSCSSRHERRTNSRPGPPERAARRLRGCARDALEDPRQHRRRTRGAEVPQAEDDERADREAARLQGSAAAPCRQRLRRGGRRARAAGGRRHRARAGVAGGARCAAEGAQGGGGEGEARRRGGAARGGAPGAQIQGAGRHRGADQGIAHLAQGERERRLARSRTLA